MLFNCGFIVTLIYLLCCQTKQYYVEKETSWISAWGWFFCCVCPRKLFFLLFSFFSFFFFFFFTVTLMCRINAVGHFTKRQVHCVAGWSGGVTSGSHSETAGHLGNFLDWLRAVGDISDPKWLEHRQCSRTTFSFNQCRSIGMQCSQYVASEGLFTLEDEV